MDLLAVVEIAVAFLQSHTVFTLIVVGFLTGIIATIVGGGMFFALPVFQFLFPGVSAGVLVGNIKVGSLVRGIGSAFTTFKLIEFKRTILVSLVAFLGTIIGASIIADLDQRWLFFIVIIAVVVAEIAPRLAKFVTPKTFTAASFLTGIYTGFLGAGSGIFLVALFRTKHPEDSDIAMVKANARFAETFLGISAVAVHFLHGNLILALFLPWSVGALIGGLVGGMLLTYMNNLSGALQKFVLRIGFAVTIGISALAFFG
jgi:uncharacterized protein